MSAKISKIQFLPCCGSQDPIFSICVPLTG